MKTYKKIYIKHYTTQAARPYFHLISEKWKKLDNGCDVCVGMPCVLFSSENTRATQADALISARAKARYIIASSAGEYVDGGER